MAALLFAILLASSVSAAETRAFARVIVAEAPLRAGPGVSYRVIERAKLGDAFLIQAREGSGFWFEVLLPDGRTAYVLGDTVEAIAIDPDAADAPATPGVFAPPALEEAHGGFAMIGGVFDGDGYAEIRPIWVLSPAIAFEPYLGLALQKDSRRLIYGGAGTLNLAPDWALSPFVTLGLGGVHEQPKEEFIREERNLFQARAGGGLLISLRLRILIRLEVANNILFTEDSYQNVQSYAGGLGTYF